MVIEKRTKTAASQSQFWFAMIAIFCVWALPANLNAYQGLNFRTPPIVPAKSLIGNATQEPATGFSALGMQAIQRPASTSVTSNGQIGSVLSEGSIEQRPEYTFPATDRTSFGSQFIESGKFTYQPSAPITVVPSGPSNSPFLPMIAEANHAGGGFGGQSNISNLGDQRLQIVVQDPNGLYRQQRVPIERSGQDRPDGSQGVESLEVLPPELSGLPDQTTEQGHEEILQYYPDGKIRIRRFVKQDVEGNYIKDGPWMYYDRNKRVVAAGRYRNGVMEGQWRRLHDSQEKGLFDTKPFNLYTGQFESIANFRNGKLNGAWTIKDQYRRTVFEISYKDGKRDGLATWWYPNGARMRVANFRDGLLDGEINEWDEGEKLVGSQEYVSGRRIIRNTTYYRPNVAKSEDMFLDAKMEPEGEDNWWDAKPTGYMPVGRKIQDGNSLEWFPNGQRKKRGAFKQDVPVGSFTWWHENGNKQIEGGYEDGNKSGRWTWWHSNGMKHFEGTYKDDQPVGVWRTWHEDGKLRKTKNYTSLESNEQGSDDAPATEDAGGASVQNLPAPKSDADDSDEQAGQNSDLNSEGENSSGNSESNSTESAEEITPLEFNRGEVESLESIEPLKTPSGEDAGRLPKDLINKGS